MTLQLNSCEWVSNCGLLQISGVKIPTTKSIETTALAWYSNYGNYLYIGINLKKKWPATISSKRLCHSLICLMKTREVNGVGNFCKWTWIPSFAVRNLSQRLEMNSYKQSLLSHVQSDWRTGTWTDVKKMARGIMITYMLCKVAVGLYRYNESCSSTVFCSEIVITCFQNIENGSVYFVFLCFVDNTNQIKIHFVTPQCSYSSGN